MVIPALCSLEADCTVSCEDDSHKEKLSSCYTALTKAITSSGSNSFQHKQIRKKHPGLVPGWNEAVRVRHGIARRAFLRWRACGSPKDGRVALHMRYARLSFKYALRKCKRERDMINVNRLAVSMLNQDNNRFWVLVKQQLGGVPLSLLVLGTFQAAAILQICGLTILRIFLTTAGVTVTVKLSII